MPPPGTAPGHWRDYTQVPCSVRLPARSLRGPYAPEQMLLSPSDMLFHEAREYQRVSCTSVESHTY